MNPVCILLNKSSWAGLLCTALRLLATVGLIAAALTQANTQQADEPPQAHWVRAQGQAPIVYGDHISAREQALRQALQQASMQVSARVNSSQLMQQGKIVVDQLKINSAARIDEMVIDSETQADGLYTLNLRAQVSAQYACATHIANSFRKSIAVTALALPQPQQTTVGRLGDVGLGFTQALLQQLHPLPGVRAIDASDWVIAGAIEPQQVRQIAQQYRAQFVLSGTIRDLSVMDEPWWKEGLRQLNWPLARGNRLFGVYIQLHDGYSGELVYQSRYATQGSWRAGRHQTLTFGSAAFWQTDYGQQVQQLLVQMVESLQQTVRCQPYIAQIKQVQGRRLYLSMEAHSGLRPGDRINVYHTQQHFDRQQQPFVQLVDTQMVAVVKQVQPNFAIADLSINAQRLNVQMDDLVMAW